MDHRDRAAPIALPRDAPIAQAILGLAFADRPSFELRLGETLGDGVLRGRDSEAVEKARIDHCPIAGVGLLADGEALGICAWRQHDWNDGQPLGAREFEVALIVRRDSRKWRPCRIP